MRVVMVLIVETSITSPDSGYESSVVDYSSISFSGVVCFEQVVKLVDQIVFLGVAWLPVKHLLAEGLAVIDHLGR